MIAALSALALAASGGLVCDGPALQGGFVVCAAPAEAGEYDILVNGEAKTETVDGYAFVPFYRDVTGTVTIAAKAKNGGQPALEPASVEIEEREFDIQRIDGLPPSKVEPRSPEEQAKVEADWLKKQETWKHRADGVWWLEGFRYPLGKEFIQSGVYGSQRVLNGEPKNPHHGIDYAAPAGEPILAPAAGEVILAEPDMYFEGGLVVIDHGQGVMGLFMHMSEIGVEEGDIVEPGQPVGKVGSTGRSTGPHLHWGLRVRGEYIDPELALAFKPKESELLAR
ncbi:MAG: M23 family metallopeptidase [Euryhalocaulis sp.]|uniref:M23 family metallopeptidase n=1 Tax=Euryhalocaulis sp. TaxID=2744307 RepID=UPI0017DB1DDC|nr:M23 family metallopeptidase [Euryhalocaulis sp.]MBA4802672.1 M23 family metallopeptidase [Euryhalocaulis sp.]